MHAVVVNVKYFGQNIIYQFVLRYDFPNEQKLLALKKL